MVGRGVGGFWATQMLRLSGNYQIIVMYNISMTIKGISVSRACMAVYSWNRLLFSGGMQATLNLEGQQGS